MGVVMILAVEDNRLGNRNRILAEGLTGAAEPSHIGQIIHMPAYHRPPAVRSVIDGKGAAAGHNDTGLLAQRGDTLKDPVGHGSMAGKGPGHQIPFQTAAIHDPRFGDSQPQP